MLPQLQRFNRWMVWKITKDGDRFIKTPYNPTTGRHASCDKPETWCDYATAKAAVDAKKYDSMGFVFGKEVGATVVDLDKVRPNTDAPWPKWALDVIAELDSYTEISASGRGSHVIVWADLPSNLNRQQQCIEVWDSNKMFALSGDIFEGRDVINTRDLASLHARILEERIGPNYKPMVLVEKFGSQKFNDSIADNWAGHYDSRSAAIQGTLWTYALKHNFDPEAMRKEFEETPLCKAWGDKWDRLGDKEISRAVEEMRKRQASDPAAVAKNILVEELDVETPTDDVPRLAVSSYDFLDALASELSMGTIIPFAFAREVTKAFALGLTPDTRPVFKFFPDLHIRQYTGLVSKTPESGKGESYKRIRNAFSSYWGLDPSTPYESLVIAHNNRIIGPLKLIPGDSLGSAEHAVREVGGWRVGGDPDPNAGIFRHLVEYDEGAKLFQKDKMGTNGQVIMFTRAFESNAAATGSQKGGGSFIADPANMHLLMGFTASSFFRSMAQAGVVGDGFLSRVVLVSDHKNDVEGDWRLADQRKVRDLVAKIEECSRRTGELVEEPGVREVKLEFLKHLSTLEHEFSARVSSLFVRDLYARSLFSPTGTVTLEALRLSMAWALHQYETRKALWPRQEGSSFVETMTAILRVAYAKHRRLSHSQAKKFANVHRVGSGGEEQYNRAHKALIHAETIHLCGANQKGRPMFEYTGE